MRVSDLLRQGLRNLSRSPLRTVLSAIGIAIGTTAVVTLLAFGTGFQNIALSNANQIGALTQLAVLPATPDRQPKPITPATIARLKAMPHVASVNTMVQAPPLRVTLGSQSVEMAAEGDSPLTQGVLSAGSIKGTPDEIILPDSLAQQWGGEGAVIGKRVTLTAGRSVHAPVDRRGGGSIVLAPDQDFPAVVAATYKDPGGGGIVYLTSELAAQIDAALSGVGVDQYLATTGYAQLTINTDDARQTAGLATRIKTDLGYLTASHDQALQQLKSIFLVINAALGGLGLLALVIAAVGIANTMIMTVLERTREIGIMKALGAEPGTVSLMFLFEAGLTGLLGGLAGVLAALGLAPIANYAFQRWVTSNGGKLVASIFQPTPQLIVGALALATVIALLGAVVPSRRAARLEALEALRYE